MEIKVTSLGLNLDAERGQASFYTLIYTVVPGKQILFLEVNMCSQSEL
jgi:hypothetical protein